MEKPILDAVYWSELKCFQVLVGFVASGYLSVLVLIIRYFTIDGYNDSGTRLPSKLDKSIVSLFSHPLMSVQTFWKYIKRLFTRQSSRLDAINVADSDSESASEGYTDDPKVLERKIARQKWRMILDELILSLSDQQMITGIAILIAGIIQLDSKISFYHWNVLVSLAWFSSLTHLSALTLLRSYFRSRLLLRMFRLFLMTGFAILLIGAMYPLYYNGARKTYEFPNPSGNITEERYLIPPSYPARCLYSSPKMDEGTVGRNLTFGATVVLVFGYTTRVIKLFSSTDSIARKVLRGWPKRLGVKMLRGIYSRMSRPKNTRLEFLSSLLWGPYLILSIVAIVVQVAYCLFESLAWEVRFTLDKNLILSQLGFEWLTRAQNDRIATLAHLCIGLGDRKSLSNPGWISEILLRKLRSREEMGFWAIDIPTALDSASNVDIQCGRGYACWNSYNSLTTIYISTKSNSNLWTLHSISEEDAKDSEKAGSTPR